MSELVSLLGRMGGGGGGGREGGGLGSFSVESSDHFCTS